MTYNAYANIAFSAPSLGAFWQCLKGLYQLGGLHAKLFFAGSVFSGGYVLLFPTLVSAATSYVNPSIESFNVGNGSFVTVGSLRPIHCVNVTNGSVIGLQDHTIIKGPPLISDLANDYGGSSGDDWTQWNETFKEEYSDWLDLIHPTGESPGSGLREQDFIMEIRGSSD